MNDALKIIKSKSSTTSTAGSLSGDNRNAYVEAVSSGEFNGTYAEFLKAKDKAGEDTTKKDKK